MSPLYLGVRTGLFRIIFARFLLDPPSLRFLHQNNKNGGRQHKKNTTAGVGIPSERCWRRFRARRALWRPCHPGEKWVAVNPRGRFVRTRGLAPKSFRDVASSRQASSPFAAGFALFVVSGMNPRAVRLETVNESVVPCSLRHLVVTSGPWTRSSRIPQP